jgi:hypothetical protein
MRQGRASYFDNKESYAGNPKSKAVSPAAVSQLGTALGNHAMEVGKVLRGASVPLYEGRGLQAPISKDKTHKGGSQGCY